MPAKNDEKGTIVPGDRKPGAGAADPTNAVPQPGPPGGEGRSPAAGTVTTNEPGAGIVSLTGDLANEVRDPNQEVKGTAERTPILGRPEVVVDGLPADAPRFGPGFERMREEADKKARG